MSFKNRKKDYFQCLKQLEKMEKRLLGRLKIRAAIFTLTMSDTANRHKAGYMN